MLLLFLLLSSVVNGMAKVTPEVLVPETGHWNASILVQHDSFLKNITVVFGFYNGLVQYFSNYVMYLYLLVMDDCNEGIRYKEVIFRKDPSIDAVIHFTDLVPGNYCARIMPVDEICEEIHCIVLNSQVVNIKTLDVTHPGTEISERLHNEQKAESETIILSAGIVILILLIIGIIGFIWWKFKHRPAYETSEVDQSKDELALDDCSPMLQHQPDIFILNSDTEETNSQAKFLANILKKGANFMVTLIEDVLHRRLVHCLAFDECLRYVCTKFNIDDTADAKDNKMKEQYKNRKIIVIETKEAFEYAECCKNMKFKNSYSNRDKDFQSGLTKLLRNNDKRFDSCHIFVVRFDSRSDVIQNNQVPYKIEELICDKRYHLGPNLDNVQQLAALCLDILGTSVGSASREKLEADLHRTINEERLNCHKQSSVNI